MRVVVATLHHFKMLPDGAVYPYSVSDYNFWRRYLTVFDEVIVYARVDKVEKVDMKNLPQKASGPNVTFYPLPDFIGIWPYIKNYSKLSALAKNVLRDNDACILRIPNHLSNLLWRYLVKSRRPYGVEVVGDPWQALSPGTYKSIFRPLMRRKFTREMKAQCQMAAVAAYVNEKELPKRYSCKCWSTYYSTIDLPEEVIISEDTIRKRIDNLERKIINKEPWNLCFIGSLWHLCKAPDVVIGAVAECIKKGLNLRITMIGGGILQPQLEDQTRKLGISEYVRFLGQIPPGKEIFKQLDKADLFILPSYSEGLPRSIVEAMARGVLCIGGSEGGFAELLEKKYMVSPIDVFNLYRVITKTLSDVEGMKQAIKRNVKKAYEYRSSVLQKRREEFYSKLKNITQEWYAKNA
jgi:glycosyltransferase involved in cell wall biosynthesis